MGMLVSRVARSVAVGLRVAWTKTSVRCAARSGASEPHVGACSDEDAGATRGASGYAGAARGATGGIGTVHGAGVVFVAVRGVTTISEVPITEEGYGGALGETVELDEKRESKSSGGVLEEANGKDDSSKTTCWETNKRFVARSRHWYPLCLVEYPRKTHRQEHGASLWGGVARGVWVTCAPEDPKVGVEGSGAEKGKVGGGS
jgi:hypothetical protein